MNAAAHRPAVALVGVHGYGRNHLAALDAADRAGTVRLAAVCDLRPPAGGYADHRRMLAETRPDIVVIATPPATHLGIAVDAARAGADILVEKPPVLDPAEHRRLQAVLAETGRACQVGFQNLGAASLAALRDAIGGGTLGRIETVTATGRWVRTDGYYQRAEWAGRRTVRGRPTGDGALTNPFAHAVQTCLTLAATAGATGTRRVELEAYRARRDIEVDDTSYLSIGYETGPRVVVAVTLCAAEHVPPHVTVRGDAGYAVLEYTTDRLTLPDTGIRDIPERVPLLDNLIAHRLDPTVPLLAPLAGTAGFTDILTVVGASAAHPVPDGFVMAAGAGADRRLVLSGVDDAVGAAAGRMTGFAALGIPWATAEPVAVTLPGS